MRIVKAKNVRIYFNDNSETISLRFGNYEISDNRIDDYQMQTLEAWVKNPTGVCKIIDSKGIEYYIFPNSITYIEIIENK